MYSLYDKLNFLPDPIPRGGECIAFEAALTSGNCDNHVTDLYTRQLSWGQYIKMVGSGRGSSRMETLCIGMFRSIVILECLEIVFKYHFDAR